MISYNCSELSVCDFPVLIEPWFGSGRAASSATNVTSCLQGPNSGFASIENPLNGQGDIEDSTVYATYKVGSITLGYQWSEADLGTTTGAQQYDNEGYGITFQVNDDLSISYEKEKSEPNTQTNATAMFDLESTGIQAAYTMGGMTLAIAMNDHQNARYQENNDVKDTTFSVAMAF